jgi:hypothetical protein
MSHIFDALRRSEAESSGIDLAALPGTTALLQQAERRAASKWEAAVLSEQSNAANDADFGTPFGMGESQPFEKELEQVVAELSQPAERFDPFSQFKSLPVSLDPQSRLLCLTDSGSPTAEAFRLLGVRLRHLRRHRPLKARAQFPKRARALSLPTWPALSLQAVMKEHCSWKAICDARLYPRSSGSEEILVSVNA